MERSNRLAERRRLGAAALELPRSTMISRSSDDSVWGAVRVVREAVDDMRQEEEARWKPPRFGGRRQCSGYARERETKGPGNRAIRDAV